MGSNLIVTQFERLKQHGMAEAVRELLMMPIQLRPSLENALVKIAESEVRHRDDAKTARLLKGAKLYCKPLMEDVICSTSRNLTRDHLGIGCRLRLRPPWREPGDHCQNRLR